MSMVQAAADRFNAAMAVEFADLARRCRARADDIEAGQEIPEDPRLVTSLVIRLRRGAEWYEQISRRGRAAIVDPANLDEPYLEAAE